MSDNEQERRCGNCTYCRRRPTRPGVQIVTGKVDLFCWGMPPMPALLPNGQCLSIRPPVSETDPACSKWRAN